jgi:MFS family permease
MTGDRRPSWFMRHPRLRRGVRLYGLATLWFWLALIALGVVHLLTDIPLLVTGRDLLGFGWGGEHVPFGPLFAVAAWAWVPIFLLPGHGEKWDPWWKRVWQATFAAVLGLIWMGLLPTSFYGMYLLYVVVSVYWPQLRRLRKYWHETKERRRQWALQEQAQRRQQRP